MQNRFNHAVSTLLLVLTMLFGPNVLRADVTGSILGVVRDSTQGVVAGAHIVATNVQNNFKQDTVSAADGSFRILALPAGDYKLTVTAPGFRTFTETDIKVKVHDQLHFDVTLDVGSVADHVEIVANAVQVQTESTQLGDVIDSKKMLALPLNGRSYLDLLGLQAGVAPATAETIQQDRPVSGSLSPGNVSVNGQRETANAFLVNGGDVSEGRNLGAGLVPNLDSVEEFRLITNSFDAEYGQLSGHIDPAAFMTTDSNGNPVPTTVDGAYWAQVLTQRLGYTVSQNEPYSIAGCTTPADAQAGVCVFPGGVIPQPAFAKPVAGYLPFIPAPTLPGDVRNYSNNSQKNTVNA